MTIEGGRQAIIIFKPKDERENQQDDKKLLVWKILGREIQYEDANSARRKDRPERFSYDLNRYIAPILSTPLTSAEYEDLKGDEANVETVLWDEVEIGPPAKEIQKVADKAEMVQPGIRTVNAPVAWRHYRRGRCIKVAVLDTGVDGKHPDLAPNMRPGVSFIGNSRDTSDPNGHGTHVAGIIAAADNGIGVVGVAPEASIIPVRAIGAGLTELIAAIDWCRGKRIDIINMSFSVFQQLDKVKAVCEDAYKSGLLLIGIAGNDPLTDADETIEAPGLFDSVVAVAALDQNGQLAGNSRHGPGVDFCAPGVGVRSTMAGGGYGSMDSGTSMAAAHVSGLAALAWSAFPTETNKEIRTRLERSANPVPGLDNQVGFGLVDAEESSSKIKLHLRKRLGGFMIKQQEDLMKKQEEMERRLRLSRVNQILDLAMEDMHLDGNFYQELKEAYNLTRPSSGDYERNESVLRELLEREFGMEQDTVNQIISEFEELQGLVPGPSSLWV